MSGQTPNAGNLKVMKEKKTISNNKEVSDLCECFPLVQKIQKLRNDLKFGRKRATTVSKSTLRTSTDTAANTQK